MSEPTPTPEDRRQICAALVLDAAADGPAQMGVFTDEELIALDGLDTVQLVPLPWIVDNEETVERRISASIALRSLPASHGALLVGVLPLVTALYAALRGHERPSRGFWGMALLGSSLVVGFALAQGGGSLHPADLLVFGAVAAAAVGYAEGGRLARSLGGPETICWALVLAAPVLLPVLLWHGIPALGGVGTASWLGFAYVTAISMFIGFFFWYRGLALGGVARVGQVQLLQPFMSLVGAALLLGEALTLANCAFAPAVAAVVFAGRRMAVRQQ
ncbi:DMT family transporter [Massilia sp. UBA6681]|uniref:DMT family transporter n=1 Tax=Massilia sp. UBA6681 TaxID=1946839 RepID=UPI0025C660F8|nr:DMT family transporter [Massilia sp. UBA6681]